MKDKEIKPQPTLDFELSDESVCVGDEWELIEDIQEEKNPLAQYVKDGLQKVRQLTDIKGDLIYTR